MTDLTAELRAEVSAFLVETGMGPTYFGQLATKNTTLVQRLELGRTVTLQTAERVRAFMQSYRDKQAAA